MEKGDLVATGPRSGVLVDELDSLRRQELEVGFKVFGPVSDVVKAWAPAVEEPADGCVGGEGFEQLDRSAEGDADALGFQGFGKGRGLA
jgi:hypothetical protein